MASKLSTLLAALTGKTPVAADRLPLLDSANSDAFQTTTLAALRGPLLTDLSYWDDFSVPLTQGKQGSNNYPAYNYVNNGYDFPQNNPAHKLYLNVQLPHRWKEGSTIYPHVHFHQEVDAVPVFKMDYRWTNIGDAVPGSWTTYVMSELVMPYTSGAIHNIVHGVDNAGISGAGFTMSSELQVLLYRDDNVYSGACLATMLDFHIEADALGSALEYSKVAP